jgi:serine/threonine protein kinase
MAHMSCTGGPCAQAENSRNSLSRKACSILKTFPVGPAKTTIRERSNSTREPNLNRVIPADARAGTTVGKYKLHEIVGRGGMGVVYRGEHVYIGKEVAVKILHDGYGGREESIKRFLREARAASLINHPNIVDITDFGKSNDGTVFFVMEFLHGEPLDALMQRERRLELIRAITIVNQIAGALGAAHAKGIVHRDLKPENVMLTKREGRRELVRQISDESGLHMVTEREKAFDFVKILDFGVAKVRDPNVSEARVTQQGVVFGTPEYMAPETARIGVSDPRTDIYALGVIFYEMLTGTIPFAGETAVDVMLKVVSEPVTPPRDRAPGIEITPEAEQLIMKALSKDPLRRQQSMEELHEELQRCYGSVRYRRSIERSVAEAQLPVQRNSVQVSGVIGKPIVTPTGTPQIRNDGVSPGAAGAAPILLTRKKERPRRTTLPLELQPDPAALEKTPPPVVANAAVETRDTTGDGGHDEWSEPARPDNEVDWAELDLDAPDGTGG